jgi:hypothetical protein
MPGEPTHQPTSPSPPAPPRLLDQLCRVARQRGHDEPTVASFGDRCRRFILFPRQNAIRAS